MDVALRNQWGEAIFRFMMGNFCDLRLVATDYHSGNYIFQLDGSVTFLDFGCVKRLTLKRERDHREIQRAAVTGDPQLVLDRCVIAGWVDAADPPGRLQLLAWVSDGLQSMLAPQPFTHTPEFAAGQLQREYSALGPHRSVLRKMSTPSDYMMLGRILIGMTAVLGAFRASGRWRAIWEEWDDNAVAATPYGKKDLAFRESRRGTTS